MDLEKIANYFEKIWKELEETAEKEISWGEAITTFIFGVLSALIIWIWRIIIEESIKNKIRLKYEMKLEEMRKKLL